MLSSVSRGSRERSPGAGTGRAPGAEWVSAPDRDVVYARNGRIDQNCLRRRRRRDASSTARPADLRDRARAPRRASCCRAAAAARPPPAPRRSRRASRTSTASGRSGRAARARRTASPTPPASAAWFSLIRIEVEEPDAVVDAAAVGDRALLERAQPRRGLARVEDLRAAAAPRDRAHDARGRGRHAREPAEEVQRRPLGGQQRPRRALDPQHRRRASRHSPSGPSRSIARVRVEPRGTPPRRRRARRSRPAPSA